MHYEYSSMTGKRKALLIGINYVGYVLPVACNSYAEQAAS